jgi:tRNA pseudouridine55 synthase
MAQKRRSISGVILLDKPPGLSSNTVLGRVRWLYQADKAGHTGTLDPFATGLLPICLGEASKFARFMLDAEKRYLATLKLGETTPTGDTETAVAERRPVLVNETEIRAVLAKFLGSQTQVPPMHSALKQDGVRLYEIARRGLEVERAPRAVHITRLDFVSLANNELIVDAAVSKGTYVRVLAEDIGAALGCGAHLIALRRTETGGFPLSRALTLDALEAMSIAERDAQLGSPESLCEALPQLAIDAIDTRIFCNGGWVDTAAGIGSEYRVHGADGAFLGIGQTQDVAGRRRLQPVRLMAPPATVHA